MNKVSLILELTYIEMYKFNVVVLAVSRGVGNTDGNKNPTGKGTAGVTLKF